MMKSQIDKKINEVDLKIDKLVLYREKLCKEREECRKLYTTKEAISLMKKGFKMVRGFGLLHPQGMFFTFENGRFKEHHSDGSVYCDNYKKTKLDFEYKKGEAFWIILKKKDYENKYMVNSDIIKHRWVTDND